MKTVLLIMRRASLAQGLIARAGSEPGFRLRYEPDYEGADAAVREYNADGALLEVTEDSEYDVDYCLALCSRLRREAPSCRLILMCPENQQDTVIRIIKAKKESSIDDFVFYDASLDYLVAGLQSL